MQKVQGMLVEVVVDVVVEMLVIQNLESQIRKKA